MKAARLNVAKSCISPGQKGEKSSKADKGDKKEKKYVEKIQVQQLLARRMKQKELDWSKAK